jgi:carbon monoxide dehydrogenase subunit G
MTGEQLLPLSRERVWDALFDVETLREAIPGCETVTAEGQGAYRVVVVAAVGPVKARFKGRLQQQDLDPPSRYTLSFEGDGGVAGFARGTAEVELSEAEGGAKTRLAYRTQAQIGGRLAQIGSRLIDATAARMSTQFFQRLEQAIVGNTPPPAGAAAIPAATVDAASAAAPAATAPREPAHASSVVPGSAGAAPLASARERSLVTVQMPAWTWAFTVAVVAAALLAAWLGSR